MITESKHKSEEVYIPIYFKKKKSIRIKMDSRKEKSKKETSKDEKVGLILI